ncbi:acyclic terpene utilization AtuA family protein [Aestuariicoccus sp. MJ-SS9]|uniref:acyclic terpene utilization AtuA family protein n=1 Tax=Aestuariicoccus sp. MJ-SS9 TaxID=3079855 RepID=UPI0029075B51|nr:acyclic terpene utilization AtuA family protein [Aestuariicoccus sp. MJ-SS9]MDU8910317.1 acyclic terpene utilization AtuA family protein [Aestuariicoccus sp. MJ-SS9]
MVRVLVPSGALGLGYDRAALARGVAARPDIIAIDGGSTDSGPHYLGTGTSKYSRSVTRAEWAELMTAQAEAGVPLVIGTAGTCGADDAVDWLLDITREVVAETGRAVRVAVLKSGQSPAAMAEALQAGDIAPLPHAPQIDAKLLAGCTNIVALAGAEQINAALATGADIVIAGRTTDTAIIAALPLARGCHPGAAWHGAKVGECGALATTQPGSGVIQLDFDETGFEMTPMAEGVRATPRTVSAHMLYENTDPFILYEPGGHLDVTGARYTALDKRRVRVEGSRWVPSDTYTVKLEGARLAGYQTVSLVTLRDPRYVTHVQQWCDDIRTRALAKVCDRLGRDDIAVELRVIGANATLGALEDAPMTAPEVGVMAIVTAPTDALSREVAKMLNPYLLHHPLTPDEEMPTFAFPFSPPELPRGAVYEFCLNHVLRLDDPMSAFRLTVEEIAP